jgi:hypothetical protein
MGLAGQDGALGYTGGARAWFGYPGSNTPRQNSGPTGPAGNAGSAGPTGAAITGDANITWRQTGTRIGTIT